MSLLVAPYNSAMRLGMGFNSYTQTLCINDAVQKPGGIPASENDLAVSKITKGQESDQRLTAPLQGASGSMQRVVMTDGQKEVSQTVSWSAQFVDDYSEITDKLDVGGSLAIKAKGIGSLKGSVQFADTSEMKKADVNYFLQVRVENQRLIADDVTQFCPIEYVQPGDFNDVYGDCFISGFIEGGDFNALVSITTEETLKKFHLGGSLSLEASFAGGSIDVKGEAAGAKDTTDIKRHGRTTINVSYTGGGDIKADDIKDWTAETLKKVAIQFPDNVAWCPQRTKAILTKYTQLRSFHERTKKGSPLDYENAGMYTASLLNAYTEYQLVWKFIQAMIDELSDEKKRVIYLKREITPSLTTFGEQFKDVQKGKMESYKKLIGGSAENPSTALVRRGESGAPIVPEKPLPCHDFLAYEPDIFGLEKASRDCRFEMIKIVREVDEVAKDPKVATDPERTWQYLAPNIFRTLLPGPDLGPPLPDRKKWDETLSELNSRKEILAAREKEIEQIKEKLEASLITPVTTRNRERLFVPTTDRPMHESLKASIKKHAISADNYRMDTVVGKQQDESSKADFFNDLDDLGEKIRVQDLKVWSKTGKLVAVQIKYSDDSVVSHGKIEGDPTGSISLVKDGSEDITEVQILESKESGGKICISDLAAATSMCNTMLSKQTSVERTHNLSMTDSKQWVLGGFYGFILDGGIESLGVVWTRKTLATPTDTQGKKIDLPVRSEAVVPPVKSFLSLPPELQEKTRKAMSPEITTHPNEHFYVGNSITSEIPGSASTSKTGVTSFSALDTIQGAWKIKSIAFAASPEARHRLGGLKVTYVNGTDLLHGVYSDQNKTWGCETESPIIAAKITTGKHADQDTRFLNTVELVRGDSAGNMPSWPLDVSTIRYLGTTDTTAGKPVETVSNLVESAPILGSHNWSLRGFYGEANESGITRLGLVWGFA